MNMLRALGGLICLLAMTFAGYSLLLRRENAKLYETEMLFSDENRELERQLRSSRASQQQLLARNEQLRRRNIAQERALAQIRTEVDTFNTEYANTVARAVKRNAGSIAVGWMPIIGDAADAAATGWDIHEYCSNAAKLDDLSRRMGNRSRGGVASSACRAIKIRLASR